MKEHYPMPKMGVCLKVFLFALSVFFTAQSFAQIATYPLVSTGGFGFNNNPAATNANVTATAMQVGTELENSAPNSVGWRIKNKKTDPSKLWPTTAKDAYHFEFPISPKAGYDYLLTGITFTLKEISNGPIDLMIAPKFQVDGTGAWYNLATPYNLTGANATGLTTPINFTTNEKFYNGHTYVIRFYVYGGPGSVDDDESFRISGMVFNGNVTSPPSIAPAVTTTAINAITKYGASATGSYQTGTNYHLVKQSGVVWSTTPNPKASLSTKTTNGSAGVINSNITGLTPGTQYYVRAYAITLVDTLYGNQLNFTTLPATVPVLTTVAASNVLSNKATTGGSNIDSGGYAVLEKGVCWNTTGNPDINSNHNLEGSGNADFASIIKSLQPGTKYYVRAFARNSLGYGYGNQIDFTTGPAVPVIAAVPGTLNFSNVSYGSTPLTLSYTLSAKYMSPIAGSITITPPATGYKISTAPNSGFVNTPITVGYSNGVLANTKIYVQASTDAYGTFNRYIVHSATGVAAQDADTVFLYSNVVVDPSVQTNSGTDFWVGFGYQERMDRKSGDGAEAKLSVYVAAGDQDATVTVSMPGIAGATGYPQTNVFIPKNTVKEFTNFPTGDASNNLNPGNLPDTRLFYTGVSSRGIHINSTNGAPVSVWMHTYANNNSAAGAMVFPTNTWNSAYTVQAYGGVTNNSNPNSFFFVIASEDGTVIEFTPKNDIVDSSTAVIFKDGHTAANVKYQKGLTYQVTLNKGQIFNAMGFIQGSGKNTANGLDLTGTTVKSLDCNKKIAVFGGNGRCLVGTSGCNLASADGSDNLIQQMFPKVAWGTKYLTVPTKNMEYNTFRITVQDPTTNVYINGSTTALPTTSLVNGLYYELEGNAPNMIESDKPITVTQFIIAGYCKSNSAGNSGNGDPEMIILSPVQQAINKATVYSAAIKKSGSGANGHYINVIIKKEGVTSFKLDNIDYNSTVKVDTGSNSFTTAFGSSPVFLKDAFKPHPKDNNYSYAKFKVTGGAAHTLSSDYPFNAIAYGMGDGESYGYNAGTAIKNLSAIKVAENPYGTDTSTTVVRTCVNNPVKLQIALSYLPTTVDSILWVPANAANVTPSGSVRGPLDVVTGSTPPDTYAHYDGTIVVDGRTFYLYSSPVQYTFTAEGTFKIKAIAYGTFTNDCGGTEENAIDVLVGHDNISFTAAVGTCGSTNVTFNNTSTPMQGTTIKEYNWTFGDGQTFNGNASTPNPAPNPHVYPPVSSGISAYWVKLETRNSVGCTYVDSVYVDLAFGLTAKFTASKDTICEGETVTFVDQSSSNAVKWIWEWNDATKNDTITGVAPAVPITHTFANGGSYTVKLHVENAAGCSSTVVDTTIVVKSKPTVNFTPPAGICLGGSSQFTNTSTPATGVTYLWNFDDPNATPSNPNTSTVKDPTHTYTSTGPFTVSLQVTLVPYGCTATKNIVLSSSVFPLPTAMFTPPTTACLKDSIQFTDNSTVASGYSITKWNWDFGDGNTSTLKNPKHAYSSLTPNPKTITLVVESDKGCLSAPYTQTITVKPVPVVAFSGSLPEPCQNAAGITLTAPLVSETSGIPGVGTWSFSGSGVTGNVFTPSTAGAGTHQVIATYTAANGCIGKDTGNFTVQPLPSVDFTTSAVTCEKVAIVFTDQTTPNVGNLTNWSWNFDDGSVPDIKQNTTHTYATPKAYNVTLTATNSKGCTGTKTKVVDVHYRPFASFTVPANVCLPNAVAVFTNNSTIGDGTGSTLSYAWDFNDPNDPTGSTSVNGSHTYTATGSYSVKLNVTSSNSCSKDTTIVFKNVRPQPAADFDALPAEVCLGQKIYFKDKTIGTVTGWNWLFGDNSAPQNVKDPENLYTKAGPYDVSFYITDNYGCASKTVVKRVTVYPYPVIDAGPDVYVLQGNSAVINATATGSNLKYKWTPNTYLSYDTVLTPVCTPTQEIRYYLTATNPGGCSSKDSVYVHLLKTPVIPNAFTPNGDGINDKWVIGELMYYTGCTVEVFDRNGHQVYRSFGYKEPWNGATSGGKPLPVGTYYYIIDPKNGHRVMTGNVTIIR